MPMREDCTHFQSRTYASGEVARFCVLDLAPEAPWRCPDDCRRYERRMVDAGWAVIPRPVTPGEPEIIELNDEAAALLDEAEDILNVAGPEIVSELRRAQEAEEARRSGGLLDRFRARFRGRPR